MGGPGRDTDADVLVGDEAADLPLGTAQIHTQSGLSVNSDHALIQRFKLTVLDSADAGKSFTSSAERTLIGSHPTAQLKLRDRSVSRFHCELTISTGCVVLRDLGSTNGTAINGVEVEVARLRRSATLSLGSVKLSLELADEQARIPLWTKEEFGLLAGNSQRMRAAFAVLDRAAQTESTVLIEGETGTGKELTAHSIHMEGSRAEGPFIVVDCGAIPHQLMESELFGHEKGAFTGAVSARKGAFAAASGGTLFLDEIGELPLDLQPKLLRALERKEIKPVGGDQHFQVDVRLIAATNRDLRSEVNAGRFRSDLYYRLAVLPVQLPPLRERLEDLPILVRRIVDELGATPDDSAFLFAENFLAGLTNHQWPGNVRELRNYVEQCLAFRQEVPHRDAVVPAAGRPGAARDPRASVGKSYRDARQEWLDEFERGYLTELLEVHKGNISAAARTAGLGRTFFYRLLWRHGLREPPKQ